MNNSSKNTKDRDFYPGFLGLFVNPFYFTRREILRGVSDLSKAMSGKLLDIGCGKKPYERLFTNVTQYVGMEFDSQKGRNGKFADIFYDGKHFPVESGSFDCAMATEVLEHIFNPDEFLSETNRALKQGGLLLLTCPFMWDEHEQPFDYARYSSFGLIQLLKNHGFEIVEYRKTAGDFRAVMQVLNCYIFKIIPFKREKVRRIFYVICISPFTVCGLFLSKILPKNKDLYLTNIVLARKV